MSKPYVTLLGKAVRYVARLRGGGSALPGLFVEKIDPDFIKRTLSQLPKGVVVISGTNGKTTTTKIVVELLESQGLKVFTNRTGSNFTRGVAAALLGEVDTSGKLDADIAVLELDEAHAVHFVTAISPKYSLLLNVMRDQLDRFGEIDATAKLLVQIARKTTGTVVLNREDPRVRSIEKLLDTQEVHYFGLDPSLTPLFPSDDDMRAQKSRATETGPLPKASVTLKAMHDHTATFTIGEKTIDASLKLHGIYNIYNAAAALALVAAIMRETLDTTTITTRLEAIEPAFGRGETLRVGGHPLELVLVKNPSGFRLSLQSFKPQGYSTMIAINDRYADGRDMSWLWDVDFDSLSETGVAVVSGIRAYEMALRLQYEEVPVTQVEPGISEGLRALLTHDSPKRIFCTYTSMLSLRRELSKITDVERIS